MELLLKAKWLRDHNEDLISIQEAGADAKPKLNRSGNPISHGLVYLARRLREAGAFAFDGGCEANLLAMVEIRDNAAHFLNYDLHLAKRVMEVGTASLKNYLYLTREWFGLDLSQYNFFIMPVSFYHGFELAETALPADYPVQISRLIEYIDGLEAAASEAERPVALKIETKLTRSKDSSATRFQITDDPDAPAIAVREEDVLATYPLSYNAVLRKCGDRYVDFSQNKKFNALMKNVRGDRRYVHSRVLDPGNPKSSVKRFYNPNVFSYLDQHYTRMGKTPAGVTAVPKALAS